MHPDLDTALARIYQHEARRRAEVGRRAAGFKTSEHDRIQLTLARLEFCRPTPAVRPKTA